MNLSPSLAARRPVPAFDVPAQALGPAADGIAALYREDCDVIAVRQAFDPALLAQAGARLDGAEAATRPWSRPNERAPLEDVQLLGTATPATPTYSAPRGVALGDYLDNAAAHADDAQGLFGAGFDPTAELQALLARVAGGRPVALARAADGRPFAPFTIRRLTAGKQIGVHHDHHYGLELYRELAPQLDTTTLVSFVATLQAPQQGGELIVYGATSADTDLPRLPSGFAYDLPAIEARYASTTVHTAAGDLFLLAAGRCLHRVNRIDGPLARITMGGFLALDRARERVLFWS